MAECEVCLGAIEPGGNCRVCLIAASGPQPCAVTRAWTGDEVHIPRECIWPDMTDEQAAAATFSLVELPDGASVRFDERGDMHFTPQADIEPERCMETVQQLETRTLTPDT